MRWKGRRRSTNVEDRRGAPAGGMAVGGLGLLALIVLFTCMGEDPTPLIEQALQGQVQHGDGKPKYTTAEEEELKEFVEVVLADTEDVWDDAFRRMGRTYEHPTLVFFTGQVASACGRASSAMGPFYCPGDKKVYIDLGFYDELRRRFGAAGDFAQAYVIAHEVGHHVQNLMGTMDKVNQARGRSDQLTQNRLSVRLELQADFLAGMWAHHAQRLKNILEPGDIEEALNAASKIGDDAIQRKTQGRVVPDAFTHGSSAQRVAWYRHGLRSGRMEDGDTFDEQNFRAVDPVGR